MAMFKRTYLALSLGSALLSIAPSAWAEKFTVAVIPDTQNYSDASLPQPRGVETFVKQMQYIVDKKEEKNLAFVAFVGDIVQHGDGQFRTKAPNGAEGEYVYWDTRSEWDNANRAVSVLSRANIPFGMAPGNHDYDSFSWWAGENSPGVSRPLRSGRVWQLYFGPESRHFANKQWYGGSFNYGMNSYQFFTGGDQRYLHLSMEMDPTPRALAWAQSVIDANPNVPVMISTHEWLMPVPLAESNRPSGLDAYFKGADNLSPDDIWDRFVRKNPTIFMILSGHHWVPTKEGVSQGENLRVDKNDAGYPVYQILQDYQGNTIGPDGNPGSANGGAGWTRFMEFDIEKRKIRVYTYSPLLDRYAGRNGDNSFKTPAHFSEFELDFPPQLLK